MCTRDYMRWHDVRILVTKARWRTLNARINSWRFDCMPITTWTGLV